MLKAVEDLSLHVLDIAENSIRADARTIEISIILEAGQDLLRVEVKDDGRGMDARSLARVKDPFFTSKQKKTGLGVPLLTQAAEQTGGWLDIESRPGEGTRVVATFRWSHIDRPAIGNMVETIMTLIAGHAEIDIVYTERNGDRVFRFDTREIKAELSEVPINTPDVLAAVKDLLQQEIRFGL